MGMTRIVVEGKVWWGRPRMRCRHKAHLGRASTLFECFAEVLPVISKRSLGRINAPERAFQM
jgi:hypothetical protein